jgi:hypothetical protein
MPSRKACEFFLRKRKRGREFFRPPFFLSLVRTFLLSRPPPGKIIIIKTHLAGGDLEGQDRGVDVVVASVVERGGDVDDGEAGEDAGGLNN